MMMVMMMLIAIKTAVLDNCYYYWFPEIVFKTFSIFACLVFTTVCECGPSPNPIRKKWETEIQGDEMSFAKYNSISNPRQAHGSLYFYTILPF